MCRKQTWPDGTIPATQTRRLGDRAAKWIWVHCFAIVSLTLTLSVECEECIATLGEQSNGLLQATSPQGVFQQIADERYGDPRDAFVQGTLRAWIARNAPHTFPCILELVATVDPETVNAYGLWTAFVAATQSRPVLDLDDDSLRKIMRSLEKPKGFFYEFELEYFGSGSLESVFLSDEMVRDYLPRMLLWRSRCRKMLASPGSMYLLDRWTGEKDMSKSLWESDVAPLIRRQLPYGVYNMPRLIRWAAMDESGIFYLWFANLARGGSGRPFDIMSRRYSESGKYEHPSGPERIHGITSWWQENQWKYQVLPELFEAVDAQVRALSGKESFGVKDVD